MQPEGAAFRSGDTLSTFQLVTVVTTCDATGLTSALLQAPDLAGPKCYSSFQLQALISHLITPWPGPAARAQVLRGHTSYITDVMVARGRLFSASMDKTVKIWT